MVSVEVINSPVKGQTGLVVLMVGLRSLMACL